MSRAAEFSFKDHRKMFAGVDKLESKTRRKVMKAAARAGAKPIRAAVRSRTPKRTGMLKIAMTSKIKGFPRSGSAAAIIGPRLGVKGKKAEKIRAGSAAGKKAEPANYMHLVENKTKAHTIAPRRRGGFLMIGGTTIRGAVRHPGTSGRKVIKRGMKSSQRAAFGKVIDVIQAAIKAEAVR